MNINILRRFIIICAVSTFVMFTFWAVYKSFVNRPPGDYETEVCDNRLKDKMWDKAIKAANEALIKNPEHRGAMMCEAIANINKNAEEHNYKIFIPEECVVGKDFEEPGKNHANDDDDPFTVSDVDTMIKYLKGE